MKMLGILISLSMLLGCVAANSITPNIGLARQNVVAGGPMSSSKARAKNYCLTASCVYVSTGRNKVLTFPEDANGDVVPVQAIQGNDTGLAVPWAVAVDKNYNIYVANLYGNGNQGSVTVYAAGSSGELVSI